MGYIIHLNVLELCSLPYLSISTVCQRRCSWSRSSSWPRCYADSSEPVQISRTTSNLSLSARPQRDSHRLSTWKPLFVAPKAVLSHRAIAQSHLVIQVSLKDRKVEAPMLSHLWIFLHSLMMMQCWWNEFHQIGLSNRVMGSPQMKTVFRVPILVNI